MMSAPSSRMLSVYRHRREGDRGHNEDEPHRGRACERRAAARRLRRLLVERGRRAAWLEHTVAHDDRRRCGRAQARARQKPQRSRSPAACAPTGCPTSPTRSPAGASVFHTGAGVDPSSPAFKAAQAKCEKFLPPGPGSGPPPSAQTLAHYLKVAQCMRRHGVPDFPDPRTRVPSNPRAALGGARRDQRYRRGDPRVPGHDQSAVAGVHTRGGRVRVPAAQPLMGTGVGGEVGRDRRRPNSRAITSVRGFRRPFRKFSLPLSQFSGCIPHDFGVPPDAPSAAALRLPSPGTTNTPPEGEGDQEMTRMNLSVAVLASAALLVAGCGGSSSSPGVAHISSTTSSSSDPSNVAGSSSPESSASAQQKMVAFSQCMRTHGVPEFPEPTEGKLLIHSSDHNGHVSGVNPQSAQFQAAQKACAKLAPNGGKPPSAAEQTKMEDQALKFSAVHAHPRGPQLPRPGILPRRRRRQAANREQKRRPGRHRPQLSPVPGRAEGLPVDHGRAEGRPRGASPRRRLGPAANPGRRWRARERPGR